MSHPFPSHPPILVDVDVSRTSQDALDEAVRRALLLRCSLILRHTTEIGWRAYGHHVLARAADRAHRRGIARSLIVCQVVGNLAPSCPSDDRAGPARFSPPTTGAPSQ